MRFAVQAALLQIFLSAEGCSCCGRSRKVYVLIAFNAVPSRSSRYICGRRTAENRGLNHISVKG